VDPAAEARRPSPLVAEVFMIPGSVSRRWRPLLAVSLVCAAATARAQQAVTMATLTGRVTDAAGGPVPGAQVRAASLERGQSWATASDREGRYAFAALPVDTYELSVEHPLFRTARRRLPLALGQALDVPVRLSLAARDQSVEVMAEAPLVEARRTQIAETVLSREVDGLPLNGRSYLDLAALTPGVSRTNPTGNQRFPETSAVPGAALSVTGQRHINNGFVVDGLSANDDAADLPGTFFSQEVIREFQVVTSGGSAELGRASAGIVNVITHSGTNDWRGRLYGYWRDDALDAKNPLARRKDPLRQWQYGATAAGPLRRDRTFLFANVEQTRLDSAGLVTISPGDVPAVNAVLERAGHRGPRVSTGSFPTGYHSTNLLARLDHRTARGVLLAARYSLYDITSPNARNAGGLAAVSRGTGLEDLDQTLAATAVVAPSPTTVNETRLQATRSRLRAEPNDLAGPAVNIAGVASLGTATNSPTARDLDLFEVMNVTTMQRGAHALKVGVDLVGNRLGIEFPGALQGVYTFPSLAGFESGAYVSFQQAFGAASQAQTNPNLGAFVQDEWRPRRDLTLSLGLRYDLQLLPSPVRADADNLAPRLGAAWAPGGGRTVVRGTFGVFYDRVPLRAISNALQRDGTKYRVAVLPLGTPGAPRFPAVLPAFPDGLLSSVTTVDPGLENACARQASVQVERALSAAVSLSAAWLHARGRGLILSRNVNVPTVSAAEAAARGIPNLGRPDPRVANVSRFESLGRSSYDGLTVSLRARLGSWAAARASYTLSRAMDDAGNAFFFSPQDSADVRAEWGPSDNDQRHRLVVSGVMDVPPAAGWPRLLSGLQLGWVWSYSSALPFNVLTGTDRNNDTNPNDRPPGVGRNAGRGFDFASLDLRVGRRFALGSRLALEAMVEAFNVLNRPNHQAPNNTFGPGSLPRPGFGRPTAAADPRQVQLGLRVEF
jgi:hypothetical protein